MRPVALQTREFPHGEDAVDLKEVNESSADIPSSSKKRKSDAALLLFCLTMDCMRYSAEIKTST